MNETTAFKERCKQCGRVLRSMRYYLNEDGPYCPDCFHGNNELSAANDRATTADAEAAAMREALIWVRDFSSNEGTKHDVGSDAWCIYDHIVTTIHPALSSTAGKALLAERDALREVMDAAEELKNNVTDTLRNVNGSFAIECYNIRPEDMHALEMALAKAKEVAHD